MQPPTTVTSYNKRIAPAVGLLRKPGTDLTIIGDNHMTGRKAEAIPIPKYMIKEFVRSDNHWKKNAIVGQLKARGYNFREIGEALNISPKMARRRWLKYQNPTVGAQNEHRQNYSKSISKIEAMRLANSGSE